MKNNGSAERTSKYWICFECATQLGWSAPDHAVTVIRGLCGHCDRPDETTLTPTCDFKGPNKKAVWD